MNKVLVADDDEDITEILEFNLRKAGYLVETAQTGKEAIIKAIVFKPEIIIIDVMMPETDGIAVCRALKNNFSLPPAQIVFFSADDSPQKREEAIKAGGDMFISKSIPVREVIKKIAKVQ